MTGDASREAAGAEPGIPLEDLEGYLKALANEKRLRLLRYLQTPHYLKEMASELGVARQTARGHLDRLLEIGVVEPARGDGGKGTAKEYVVVPHRIYDLTEALRGVGDLRPDAGEEAVLAHRTSDLEDEAPDEEDPTLAPRLTVVHGMRLHQQAPLVGDGPWAVGRDPHAHLCLDYDPYVSHQHAEVRRDGSGGFLLVDLYSSNGTYLEREPLDRGGEAPLEPGSIVRMGKTLILFRGPR